MTRTKIRVIRVLFYGFLGLPPPFAGSGLAAFCCCCRAGAGWALRVGAVGWLRTGLASVRITRGCA